MNIFGKLFNKSLDVFGNAMKKTSMQFQLQSALAAYGLIWCSTIFMFCYFIWEAITNFTWWYVFYALNSFCGILIIYSMLVSTFISYLQIKAVLNAQEMMKGLEITDNRSTEQIKKDIIDEHKEMNKDNGN